MDLAEPEVPMAKSQPVRFMSLLMRWISLRAAEMAAWKSLAVILFWKKRRL